MFPVIRVNQPAEDPEQLGTKTKFWYTGEHGRRMLFKAEERGYGEDWSEKVVCELAQILGIPHVHYEMAFDETAKAPGVVCEMMLQPGQILVHGNTMLQRLDPAYPHKVMRVSAHTVEAVFDVVRRLDVPGERWAGGLPPGIKTGLDVFCGYLLLDAWVANQDRHHENWAAIFDGERLTLAPSYDHGSALARNVGDQRKAERLRTNDLGYSVAAFAARARSRLFAAATDERALTALEAFARFAARAPSAAAVWRNRLAEVDEKTIAGILAQVPPDRLSAVGSEFTLQLLLENQKRILATREEG